MTSLSVIIPTHNRAAVLKQALRHLAQGSVKPDEVIVIDDGSPEPVSNHIEREEFGFPLNLIRFEKNQGAPAARNTGIRAAKGDILVFQDDDIFADQHMIRYHKKIHQQHPEKTYGVMGRIYFDPDLCRNPLMHYLEEYGPFRGITKSPDKSLVTTGLISANFSLKRELLKGEELFDEHFPFNRNEDTEFGLRMMEKGLRLHFHIAPSARHHSPLDIGTFFRQLRQGGYSKAYWAKIRPDDSEHCLRLALALSRKTHEAQFNEYFDKYIDAFGDKFLSSDISECSMVEFEEFKSFMENAIGWIYFITLVDGWEGIIPNFPKIFKNLLQASETSKTKKKIEYLRRAFQQDTGFFPMAVFLGEVLCNISEYSEAYDVLIPFKNMIWGKLDIAKINYHLGKFEACFELLQEVFEKTKHGKAVEMKQRIRASKLLTMLLKKKNEKWVNSIWLHLNHDDFMHNRSWCEINGNKTNLQMIGPDEEKPLAKLYQKMRGFEGLKKNVNNLTEIAHLFYNKCLITHK